MYEVIGGGTYRDGRFETAVTKATQKAREDDVILIVMGSNDTRNIAREKRSDTIPIIRAVLVHLAKEASEKKFQLLVTDPLPSPCYGTPGSTQWCEQFQGQQCEHEKQYKKIAEEDIKMIIIEATKTSVANTYMIRLKKKFQKQHKNQNKGQVQRTKFVENDIHLNSEGGDILSSLPLQQGPDDT